MSFLNVCIKNDYSMIIV